MGIFDGVKEAKQWEEGRKLPEGVDHKVRIEKILVSRSARHGGNLFIVEYTLLASPIPTAEIGGRYSWVQDMKDSSVAFPNLKQFGLACMKADKVNNLAHYEECVEKIEVILAAAADPAQQYFVSNPTEVLVSTKQKKTKNGHDFLAHTFRIAA